MRYQRGKAILASIRSRSTIPDGNGDTLLEISGRHPTVRSG
jgi:hypothetical protein